MTKNLWFIVAGLGAVAALVLLVEFAAPIFAVSSDTLESSRARSERAVQKKADTMVAEIVTRPLFTPGRQVAAQIKIARAEAPQLQGRLAGVMQQDSVREALFARPGGKPVAVKEGEVIDGWTVEKIDSDQVRLTSAFGEQVVRPTNGGADEITVPAPRAVTKNIPPAQQPNPPVQPPPAQLRKATQSPNAMLFSRAMGKSGATGQ